MVDIARLVKIEDRIQEIVTEMGFSFLPVEFDIVPSEKMLEIMAYRSPSNISSWKFGRDYERLKTIYNDLDPSLPYEVVVNSDIPRAFLMNSNTFAVHVLVMAHVYAHVVVFTENKWFQKSRRDIIAIMNNANIRFNEHEKMYGLNRVEQTVDAGHALQFHSDPFNDETEEDRKKKFFEKSKKLVLPDMSEFNDIVMSSGKKKNQIKDIEEYNYKLWQEINSTTPVEPTDDLLRYIIDNSRVLENWQKDILETLRTEGQYYWPVVRTKHLNEGFACFMHEKILKKLFDESFLTSEEHGQYNYSNSLVKAHSRFAMNPYLIGSAMFEDIEERWNKGRYGRDWLECKNADDKENWDTKEMNGWEKIKNVMRTYTDWFFMQDFLTHELIDKLDLYIYVKVETPDSTEYVRTDHSLEDIRNIIIGAFSNNGIPKIEITNGNFNDSGDLYLEHRYAGQPLNMEYAVQTLKHIKNMWGRTVHLSTYMKNKEILIKINKEVTVTENINTPTIDDDET